MTTEPTVQPDTAKFFYEYGRSVLAEQLSNTRQIDTKTVQVFAAAGVALGLAGFSRGAIGGTWYTTAILIGAVVAYLAAGVCVWKVMRPHRYDGTPDPAKMWADYWHLSPEQAQHAVVDVVNRIYPTNQVTVDRKARWMFRAMLAAGAEFALIGLAVISVQVA